MFCMRSLLLLFLLVSCHPCRFQQSYQKQYAHLEKLPDVAEGQFNHSDYSLLILVDAKHLDYSDAGTLVSTIAKHPNGSREQDIGHAWILLSGIKEGKRIVMEGGHSGELGVHAPRYLEGIIMNQHEPNPIRYLFSSLPDGYFEKGPGRHKPTYAIGLEITEEQFLAISDLIEKEKYNFSQYSLTENQCVTFVSKAAAIAGIELEHEVTVTVPQYVTLAGKKVKLWQDDKYKELVVSTPDRLEKSMMEQVAAGHVRPALHFYTTVVCSAGTSAKKRGSKQSSLCNR
jgi:hypothetical protein